MFAFILLLLYDRPAVVALCTTRSERLSSKRILAYQGEDDKPRVERLRWIDIPRAVDTHERAFEHDPIFNYAKHTPDYTARPWHKSSDRATLYVRLLTIMAENGKTMFSIDRGKAIAILTQADELRGDAFDKAIEAISVFLLGGLSYMSTPQQRKRTQIVHSKISAGWKTAGPRLASMLRLHGLMVHPDMQGQGSGSALVDVVKAYADAEGRPLILCSSNEANTGFYEFHGFETLTKIMMGDDDPTWDEKPFPVRIMVREPDTTSRNTSEKAAV